MTNEILEFLIKGGVFSVSEIYEYIITKEVKTAVSVKRLLSKLVVQGFLIKSGKGRSVKYQISTLGRLNLEIDIEKYCSIEVDKRVGLRDYNFELFDSLPESFFSKEEIKELDSASKKYHKKILNVSEVIHKKELERFVIELSWKSSKIEGNTYTLLDTEKLLKDGIEAKGKTKDEAVMIINHKNAFDFIYKNKNMFKEVSVSKIEDVHKILIKDLGVTNNLRSNPVGVLGSKYKPLDNKFQIEESAEKLCKAISKMADVYSKALFLIIGISYIQPFEDGNKRTSRLMGNAILLTYGLAPLSYRIVDEETYRESVMVFYELNSIASFKKIFFEQYIFSTENYLI